jgi:DNA repair exonuclease SbcCD nuclease subunit
MIEPRAVLISDVHYSLQTLEVADQAVRMAIAKSKELDVPLIVCGDLHDTKANLRGECVKAMLNTFGLTVKDDYLNLVNTIVLVGNHDRINEKSTEHSLEFLRMTTQVVNKPTFTNMVGVKGKSVHLIPYQHDTDVIRNYLKKVDKGSTIIMHQGVKGSASGEYIQDRTALTEADLAGFRVISGHYHQRQSFKLPDGGQFDYVGNPYTFNFGEANDPDKGFQILMDDGSLEFVPTNLRKHRVIDRRVEEFGTFGLTSPTDGDLFWVKVRGTSEQLAKVDKDFVTKHLYITSFRLTLISDETTTQEPERSNEMPQDELFDSLIDSLNVEAPKKNRLKNLWKTLLTKD